MNPPATPNDAVALVRRSRLVPDDRLQAFLAADDRPDDLTPADLLARMVDAGLLTAFQADHLRAGRCRGFLLGRYRLLDKIGTGGMGQVFLAEHTAIGRRVAVKVLNYRAADRPLAKERFVREATAAARVAHPNIVHVYDVDALAEGYVTVTPLKFDLTDHARLAELRQWEWRVG